MADAARRVIALDEQQAMAVWPVIAPMLERVIPEMRGELLLEDAKQLILQGKCFVCVMLEGSEIIMAGVLEVVEYPRLTVLNTIMLAGRGVKYLMTECKADVQQIARVVGATRVRGFVHESVARLHRRFVDGAKEIYTVVEIDL